MTQLVGVDLSHWNKVTSFKKLAAAAAVVIHKATEGTGFIDTTFAARIAELRKSGIMVGSYHFASGGDPIAEATHYLKVARPRRGEIVALDVEAEILTRRDLVAWCTRWLAHVITAAPGAVPVIYMSSSEIARRNWTRVADLKVQLWAARYSASGPATGAFRRWMLWQYTSAGTIDGVAGKVDLNRIAEGFASPTPATPPAKPAAPPAKAPKTSYTVRAGDTLAKIARKHGTTWRKLVAWNKDRYPQLTGNPNLIEVGWKLVVAAGATPPNRTVTVKPGDSLSGIAAATKTTVRALVDLNHARYPSLVRDPGLIHPGWILYLP